MLRTGAAQCRSTLRYASWSAHQNDPSSTGKVRLYATADQNHCRDQDDNLTGRTIGIKANIVTRDGLARAGSKILNNYRSPFNATVVRLLLDHGARITPDLEMDEFGMGSHSQYSHHGPVSSPFSRRGQSLSPGGSSGGSAVAVQANACWAALGTDTGGSIRLPAAYTGVVGFKPSYGLVSRWGVIQYANSLDTVGVIANRASHARSLFSALDKHDPSDPTSLTPAVRQRLNTRPATKSLRIGIPDEYNIHEISPEVRASYAAALRRLQAAGHTLHRISLPSTRLALSAYYILAPAEASSNLAKYDGVRYGHRSDPSPDARGQTEPHAPPQSLSTPEPANPTDPSDPPPTPPLYARTRGAAFGPEVQRRILLGAYTLSSGAMDNHFVQAQRVRRLVQRDFDRVFARANPLLDNEAGGEDANAGSGGDGVDVLMVPTAPTLPPTVAEVARLTPVESYMNDVFTVPASLAGLPAISVPVPLAERDGVEATDAQSIGLQIIGQFGDDRVVLDAAEMVEKLMVE